MAHISISRDGLTAYRVLLNGMDVSDEVFGYPELVTIGEDDEFQQMGIRLTFGISSLDLGGSDYGTDMLGLRENLQRINENLRRSREELRRIRDDNAKATKRAAR